MADAEEEGSGSPSPPNSPAPQKGPPPSEVQVTIGEQAKYIADHFDKLYDAVAQLKKDLGDTETRLRAEMDLKIKTLQDALTLRIEALEKLTIEHSIKFAEAYQTSKQQANQMDELQNQVGVLFFRLH